MELDKKNLKNVYMIQISTEYAGSVYLPYAVGSIAAYAWSNNTVKGNYCLKPFIYRKDDIDYLLTLIESPYIAAFSGYIWNFEFSKAFAEKLKNKYPDCIVIFGGHSTPGTESFLDEHSYIDFLIMGEGEKPFTDLLCALSKKGDLKDVSNIIYRTPAGKAVSSKECIITDINFPSPYTEGYFDEIIKNDKETKFSAIIETNRGCPYCCSYCDWGVLNEKVRLFPPEKVLAEIDWLCLHNIEYLYFADANFGMFERDLGFAKKIAAANSIYGYPQKFFVNYTKNSNLRVFEINNLLNKYNLSKGATLSFQSLSPKVLKTIRRTNMNYKHFSELMILYNSNNIMTYSELILGLPEETYGSFANALGKLLEAGQHTSIIVVKCHCLVNSEMGNPEYMNKHKIKVVQAPLNNAHCIPQQKESIVEYSQIVISTSTMSRNMWVRTELLSLCVQCYHSLGVLQYFAIYLFAETGLKYEDFYSLLINWLHRNPETISGRIFSNISKEVKNASVGQGSWFYFNELFGKITWPFEEGMYLEIVYHIEKFYSEITDFLMQFEIEKQLFHELLNYQKAMIKLPNKTDFEFRFGYDFYKYFNDIFIGNKQKLNPVNNIIKIRDKHVYENWDKYAMEVVWYGRRGGKSFFADIEQNYL